MDLTKYQTGCTYQEIIRQQEIWRTALSSLFGQRSLHGQWVKKFKDHVWVFSGCGTSYYLAQTGACLFEMITGFRTRAVPASEILTYPQLVFNPRDRHLLVAISRSGTTTEILWAAQKVKKDLHLPVLTISCDSQSPMAQEGDYQLVFPFPSEQSVVMTGSFTTMLFSIVYLALQDGANEGALAKLKRVAQVSQKFMQKNETAIAEIAAAKTSDFVFLAQGPFLGLANEASLKIKEMSISSSVSFHALEFRHGPMSIVTGDTLVTIILSEGGHSYELQLARDLKKLGARLLLLHGTDGSIADNTADFSIQVPSGYGDWFNSFLYMPLLQLLGYYYAKYRGINPDKPKNLTAVVTLHN